MWGLVQQRGPWKTTRNDLRNTKQGTAVAGGGIGFGGTKNAGAGNWASSTSIYQQNGSRPPPKMSVWAQRSVMIQDVGFYPKPVPRSSQHHYILSGGRTTSGLGPKKDTPAAKPIGPIEAIVPVGPKSQGQTAREYRDAGTDGEAVREYRDAGTDGEAVREYRDAGTEDRRETNIMETQTEESELQANTFASSTVARASAVGRSLPELWPDQKIVPGLELEEEDMYRENEFLQIQDKADDEYDAPAPGIEWVYGVGDMPVVRQGNVVGNHPQLQGGDMMNTLYMTVQGQDAQTFMGPAAGRIQDRTYEILMPYIPPIQQDQVPGQIVIYATDQRPLADQLGLEFSNRLSQQERQITKGVPRTPRKRGNQKPKKPYPSASGPDLNKKRALSTPGHAIKPREKKTAPPRRVSLPGYEEEVLALNRKGKK